MRSIYLAIVANCLYFLFSIQGIAQPVCPKLGDALGPVILLAAPSSLTLYDDQILTLDHGRRHDVFDLSKLILPSVTGDALVPAKPRSQRSFKAQDKKLTLRDGRSIHIHRLYGGVSLLLVGRAQSEEYLAFAKELENGRVCDAALSTLSAETVAKMKPAVLFYFWELLAQGTLDRIDDWKKRVEILKIFTTKAERDLFFESYAYRAASRTSKIPAIANTDPFRVWVFAYRSVYMLLDGKKEDRILTDLAIDQSGNRVNFRIFSSIEIEGAEPIKRYGFWTKLLKSQMLQKSGVQNYYFDWTIEDARFRSDILIKTLAPTKNILAGFPKKFRRGFIVIDSNFDKIEISDVIEDYVERLEQAGFVLGPREASLSLTGRMREEFASEGLDWIIRDGHAELGHDVLFSFAKKGFSQKAVRRRYGQEQIIFLFYPDAAEMKDDPDVADDDQVTFDMFRRWLSERKGTSQPFAYVDNACWGMYKARSVLAAEKETMFFIGSTQPVNFINAADVTAGSLLLDALLNGSDFASLRRKLARLESRPDAEDRFILPDEKGHPHRIWLMQANQKMERSMPDGNWKRYIPD